MPARALWKAAISFDGISLPVKVYPSVKDAAVHFRLIHRKDSSPLEQAWVCAVEEKPVAPEEIVKGVEVSDGRFVIVDPEDLRALEPESSRTIEVREFVRDLDARYCSHPYYVGPDGSDALFASFRETLAESGGIGLCEWVMRKRSYLGAVRPFGTVLYLVTLHHEGEIVSPRDLEIPEATYTQRELATAGLLIRELADRFDPAGFVNEHQKRLHTLVEQKARGKKPRLRAPKRRKPAPQDDLMGLLEASVTRARRGATETAAPNLHARGTAEAAASRPRARGRKGRQAGGGS